MRVEGDILIDRPIEEVFDYVADERNEPQYNPQMTSAEKISPGPIGVGTRFRSVMTGTGVTADMTIEFTEFERPNRITERTRMSNMEITGTLYFDEVGEATRMKWVWDLVPQGVYRFLGPLVRWMGDRQEQRIWTELKRGRGVAGHDRRSHGPGGRAPDDGAGVAQRAGRAYRPSLGAQRLSDLGRIVSHPIHEVADREVLEQAG